MSKRPKTANSFMSRLRRPAGRLRDLPIWSKLGLIMIVPTLATIVVGTNGLIDHIETADNADRARDLAVLTEASGELVNQLQNERAAAIMFLGAAAPDQEKYRAAYDRTHAAVDRAKVPYSQQRASLNELPVNLTTKLTSIDQSLQDLPGTRSQVTGRKNSLTDIARSYDFFVSDLLDMRDLTSQLAADTSLSERMRAASAVARGKEYLSQERDIVHVAFGPVGFTPKARTDFIATQTGQRQSLDTFGAVASSAEEELYDQTVAGADLRVSRSYDGWVSSTSGTTLAGAPFTPDEWDTALASHARLIRTVERSLDSQIVTTATNLRDDVQQQVLVETGLLLGMLLLAILFAWLVARSMARSLRELRHGALSVAQFGLPQAVARLRDPSLSTQMSPVQVANQIAEPLPVRSRDEFGQVTEAFNAVHLEAVRTAAEQAALRSSVATMFVNLARRSQILVDRLIGHLDRLERGEEDPDRLAELFQLDHLATRMRRNDENLLVLAGADSTRIQREPAALIDVLRAAQSEVEHYTRIEFGIVDRDIEVAAHAVNDLVHLVAELFDNATAFSPPDSSVMVEARRVGDRAALYVEDRGIGITPEQLHDLNERLAEPPMVDVAVSRMMGLVVVARLANRHNVKVELRPAAERGTIADVTLPTSVLVPRALGGRAPQAGGFDIPMQAPAVTTRQPFPAPLALESGPMGGRPGDSVGGRPFDPTPLNGGSLINPAAAVPGRGMPAWSDLTGATGSPQDGNDGFTPPRPPNGQRAEPLPQRRGTDAWTVEGEVTASGPAANGVPGIPRQMPFDADQTRGPSAFSGPPISGPPNAGPPVISAPPAGPMPAQDAPFPGPNAPFPAADAPFPAQDAPFPGPNAPFPAPNSPFGGPPQAPAPAPPRGPQGPPAQQGPPPQGPQIPQGPQVPHQGQPPVHMPPPSAPMPQRPDAPVPAAAAPPSWPPVADQSVPPTVPENLAAALDMTAELPQVDRHRAEAAAAQQAAAQQAAAQDPLQTSAQQPERSAPILPVSSKARFADETMELPIFRELESAWFRTRRSSPEESLTPTPAGAGQASGAAQGDQFVTADTATRMRVASSPTSQAAAAQAAAAQTAAAQTAAAAARQAQAPAASAAPAPPAPPIQAPVTPPPPAPRGPVPGARPVPASPVPAAATPPPQVPLPQRPMGNGNGVRHEDQEHWRTAADDGWRAASAAAEMRTAGETTQAGLPRRVPMAQLVPGGVDKSAASVQRRTPEAVRGLLSAYHRGVQRGRTQPKDEDGTNPEATPAGQQPSQAGRGPGAGSGQKEQER